MPKKLYRIEQGKVLTGVCGGLGEYFNVDPNIVRIVTLVGTACSVGLGLIAYIIASVIVPTKSNTF